MESDRTILDGRLKIIWVLPEMCEDLMRWPWRTSSGKWDCVVRYVVVSCSVPVGKLSWMLFQEGRSSNLMLRWGVGQAANNHNNPHVKFTGVYCTWIVNNAVTSELYWVLLSWLWVSSLSHSLIVQLQSKLLVTVRDTSAYCNKAPTLALVTPHIASAINIYRDHK